MSSNSSHIHKPLVSVVMVKKGYEEVEDTIRQAINLIGGVRNYVEKGEKVLIKPNLCVAKPATSGVTTNPKIVEECMHEIVGATPSLKNMKGVLPGIEKHVSHRKGLEKAIADLCSDVKPTLAIIDGIVGNAGASSFTGKPVKSNLILTGNDPVAVDAISSYIMGFNPGEMDVLRHASMKGVGVADISNISVTGEDLESLRLRIAPLFTKTKLKDRFIRYVEVKINEFFHRSVYPVAQFFRKIPETSFVTFSACMRGLSILC